MLLAFNIPSVNAQDQLPKGWYTSSCHIYRSPEAALPSHLYMFEHVRESDGQIAAIDLVSVDELGDIRFADFLRMADGGWRDNFGERSDDLAHLLPDSVRHFIKIQELEGRPFTLEHGHGTKEHH